VALPDGGAWPPAPHSPIYRQYRVLDAWYRGDADELARIYGAESGARVLPADRPSQYRGGIVGRVARWFWGAPTPPHQKRTKLHVPVASDIATMSADLLFSEPPEVVADDQATRARLEALMPELHPRLLEGAELGAALGGYYLRAVWDTAVSPMPWLDVVAADAAVPEWRWGRLSAVTFWRVVEPEDDKNRCLVHLERHEPGAILHGLYRLDDGEIDRVLPLDAHPATTGLEPVVDTRIRRLTAVYVPNQRPNRDWRRDPVAAPLGRSDFAGPVLGLFDALDETWSSWLRDIRLGKGRLVVPSGYLQDLGPGRGAAFDLDREVYEPVEALDDGAGLHITATQFAIRVAEHRDTAAELLTAILRATGYSAQSFGLSGDVAMTATEVAAKERRSLVTRGRKTLYTRVPLGDALEMLLALERARFGSPVPVERPRIEFGDSVAPDPRALAETADMMRRAEAASTYTLVKLLHPDWEDVDVLAEVDRIRAEGGMLDPVESAVEAMRRGEQDADPADQDGADTDAGEPGE